jgi:surface carbohydrate biosynthesis protein
VRQRTVLILIDQASRDAVGQLLTARYLRRKGVRVLLCNQGTLKAMSEAYRPDVIYTSWHPGGPLMEYLLSNRNRPRIVLIDQEGARIGPEAFERSFRVRGAVKAEVAKACAKIVAFGAAQARWLCELGVVPEDRVVITGTPKFDPYLVARPERRNEYLGVTLRADQVTSSSASALMEATFDFAVTDAPGGIGVGYPPRAQFEDKIWHVIAMTRYLFKVAAHFASRSRRKIVFRPGPWERSAAYAFLPARIPSASVDANRMQHKYVEGAFALLDESSTMGLQGLVASVPVISIQSLIPRLEDHIGGEGAGFFNAPSLAHYWRPKTVDEAVDLLLQAEQGRLAPSPCPEAFATYVYDYHAWPRRRPSSFQIGDVLLEQLELARDGSPRPVIPEVDEDRREALKRALYRHLPGVAGLTKARLLARHALAADREQQLRYHYYASRYPHHARVAEIFEALWARYEGGSA